MHEQNKCVQGGDLTLLYFLYTVKLTTLSKGCCRVWVLFGFFFQGFLTSKLDTGYFFQGDGFPSQSVRKLQQFHLLPKFYCITQ